MNKYKGGRIELFEKDIKFYDFNSLYPEYSPEEFLKDKN